MRESVAGEGWATEDSWTHGRTRVNDVELHYVTAGPEDGDLVVLLHGFPEFWYSWREQIPALAEAGYRVVAPDLRGYNRSSKPDGIDAYHIDELVADVVGLVEAIGRESANVVGHDWGGLLAWQVAIDRPDVVDRLAVVNAPHPSAYERELRSSFSQLLKSWYVFFFQIPRLPEWSFAYDDFAGVEKLYSDKPGPDGAITEDDVERYKEAISRPGSMTAAINYYRSAFRRMLKLTVTQGGFGDLPVDVPTLLIWGLQDPALDPSLTEGLDEWVDDLRVERFADASHWVHLDASERVNEELLAFL